MNGNDRNDRKSQEDVRIKVKKSINRSIVSHNKQTELLNLEAQSSVSILRFSTDCQRDARIKELCTLTETDNYEA